MCYERARWVGRESRREERFDEELRRLLDEEPRRPGPAEQVVEDEHAAESQDEERVRAEAGTGS